MKKPNEINFCFDGELCRSVKSYIAPLVGERVQISSEDFIVKERYWAVDATDDYGKRSLRLTVDLRLIEPGDLETTKEGE